MLCCFVVVAHAARRDVTIDAPFIYAENSKLIAPTIEGTLRRGGVIKCDSTLALAVALARLV